MQKIAVSTFRNRISSRLDSAEEILLLTIENEQVKNRETIRMIPSSPLDKMHQIKELHPDVLICGGLTQLCNNKIKNYSITVIPWMKGYTEEVISEFLDGKLSEPMMVNSH